MGLHSPLCDLLGIEVPIVLAGMGGASTPELTAAVSNAGGLGILGAAACSPDELREWIARTRKLTSKPFGVDTLLPASVRRSGAPGKSGGPSPMDQIADYVKFAREFMAKEGLEAPPAGAMQDMLAARGGRPLFSNDFFEAQMKVVIESEVAVYAAGLGDPGPYIDRLHAAGTKVMAVVGAVRHARKVIDSGIDVVVAQGHDAGGHNSPIGTMALVPQVVDVARERRIPVLAAGGIGDGRGIAAAFMLGAQGVWIGTRFLATTEAGLADFQKQAIVESSEENTVVSKSVTGKPARLIRNKWADAFAAAGREPLPMPFQSIVSGPVLAAGLAARRKDIVPGFAGQIIGMIKEVKPTAEVMRDLIRETEAALRAAGRFV